MSQPTDVEIFDLGRIARHSGLAQVENPYPVGSPEHRLWDTGWLKAKGPDEDKLLGFPFQPYMKARRRLLSRK